uniref:Uncharacterized protein n=1 Tax=Peronospora matthiolae TaxID=2874970 RepID=A0AAV1UR21_9STRA
MDDCQNATESVFTMPTQVVPFGNKPPHRQLQQLVPFRLFEPFSPKIVRPV